MNAFMMTGDNQHEVLRRAQEGDASAFESLQEESRAELEKYVRARVGSHVRARVDLEDVFQEVWARAWQSISELKWSGKDTFLRWLKGIARHVILQQAGRRQPGELIFVEPALPSEEPSPSRALRREERMGRLQKAVDQLPPDYREAVVLIRLEGLPINQAAERMGRSPKAVTHLLSRGLKKLKDLLSNTESFRLPPRHLDRGEPR